MEVRDPDDLPFKRIAGMLNIYGLKDGGHARVYLDNRVPNRAKYEEWARTRMGMPYVPANFEGSLLGSEYARLYLPDPGSAKFDPASRTAIAADGSRLQSDNRHWGTGLDRDGRKYRIYAIWTSADGGKQVSIAMLPFRGYRKGYGETRQQDRDRRGPPKAMANAATPDGKTLADLINVMVPIAGEHAGHMVVVDDRTDPHEIR